MKAQGISRAPLPHMPYPLVTGKISQIGTHLTERLNQWQAAHFRKFALQILDSINKGELIPSGVNAAIAEERLRGSTLMEGGSYVPQ